MLYIQLLGKIGFSPKSNLYTKKYVTIYGASSKDPRFLLNIGSWFGSCSFDPWGEIDVVISADDGSSYSSYDDFLSSSYDGQYSSDDDALSFIDNLLKSPTNGGVRFSLDGASQFFVDEGLPIYSTGFASCDVTPAITQLNG